MTHHIFSTIHNSVQSVSHTFITLFTFQITVKAHRCKGHDYDRKEKSQKEKMSFFVTRIE